MIAGAGVRIDAEPFANHALPFPSHFRHQRLYAALLIEVALALRDDHFGTALFGGERASIKVSRIFATAKHVGAGDGAHSTFTPTPRTASAMEEFLS